MKKTLFLMVLFAAMVFGFALTVSAVDQININTASKEELMQLEGIGAAYAQAIIDYREANGLFKQPSDITAVKGIGPVTFEKNKDRITVGSAGETKAEAQKAETKK